MKGVGFKLAVVAGMLALTACGDTTGDRGLSGAGIGAAVGAVGGALVGDPLAGAAIGAVLSLLVILWAGTASFWDILLPGMLLGVIVGFSTQKFGTPVQAPRVAR